MTKAVAPTAVKTAQNAIKNHPNWYMFPLVPGSKDPWRKNYLNNPNAIDKKTGKRLPFGSTNDLSKIKMWASDSNVGLVPTLSNLVLIDVDTKKGKVGAATLADLEFFNRPLPETLTVETPSGGFHFYFEATDKVKHRFALGKDGFGPDIDAPHYVAIPGSVVNGKAYRIIKKVPIVAAPDWFADYLKPKDSTITAADQSEPAVDLDQPDNIKRAIYFLQNDARPSIQLQSGEKALFDTAAVLKDLGISYDTAVELIDKYYNVPGKCEPQWSLREGEDADRLENKIANAYDYATQTQPGALGITAEADFRCDPVDSDPPDPQSQDDGSKFAHLEIIRADTIKMTIIDWLWPGHLALGQHTCIAGVQGDGKSQLVYALIAAVTTGGCWPGSNESAPLGNCIILSAEDTDRDVLAPRLKAAGADLRRVHIIKASVDEHGRHNKVLLQRDMKLIEAVAKKIGNVKLISVDPISSYLGGDIDSHNNTELRAALDPITQMAEATGCAVVSITHFNKASKGVSAMNRIMGSVAFVAAPRAAFVVLRDDEDENKRLFLPVKLNLASVEEAYGMSFEIEEADTGVKDDRFKPPKAITAPRVKWLERVGKTADAVLSAGDKSNDGVSAIGAAMSWLTERLAFEPELQKVIEEEVTGADLHTWATMRREAKKLGVVSRKRPQADGHGPYEWVLPEVAADATDGSDLSAMAPEGYQTPTDERKEELQ